MRTEFVSAAVKAAIVGTALLALPGAAMAQDSGAAADLAAAEAQLRDLMAQPVMVEAFRVIEELEPETTADLITLTEVPAPPFAEEERARVYADWLLEAGADSVYIDEEGNVVAIREGRVGDRTIALGGHLDTVFPEGTDVTVRTVGDTLFAPGIGDDTRGLMVVLTVLRAMERTGLRTDDDLRFVGVVGEEGLGDLRGMKHLFRDGAETIDTWIEVDGGGIGHTVHRGLGSVRYRAIFRGPGGHSWGAFGMANPAHALGRAITTFVTEADPLTRTGPRTSYNVGTLGGGTSVNSIPFEAVMEVDMRSEDPAALERMHQLFRETMTRGLEAENANRREGPELELELLKVGDRPSGEISVDHPLVVRSQATAEILGAFSSLGISSTDSNIPLALGVPAVTIGRGGVGGEGHSPGEWWINRNGHLAIQRALLLLVSEAGLARTAMQ
ncbi:M20/M25/M40 family metallo-hydrolase [Gaopeijia maritima]|uniref:M20/M25/M40 family metallo-hydrolase n=1 Tax=Gaopeijia maritima TaxID=3119007 RepID=A0ABU9E9D5_9BACT